MNPRILKFSRHFLTSLLITLTGLSASAIVSFSFTPSKAPTVTTGFETQMREYLGPDDGKPVDYVKHELKHFGFRFKENADQALLELGGGFWPTDTYSGKNIEEFRHLQADLVLRGYEPVEEDRAMVGKKLSLYYDRRKAGPKKVKTDDGVEFVHDFQFAFQVDFQRQGKKLEQHESYPQATLSGYATLICKKEFADCVLTMTYIDRASISWETVPGFRGGNSSAGGGPRASDMIGKAALTKKDVEKILKSQRSR